VGALIIVAGLAMLAAYRATLRPAGGNSMANIGLGAAGLLVLLLGTYVLLGSITRFFDPEKWPFHHHAVRTLTSWNVIWRYMVFLSASVSITGGAVLFFFFRWPGGAKEWGAGEARFVKNLGAGAIIAGAALFPVFGFFYLFTLPIVSLSRELYGLGVASLGVLFAASVYAYRAILSPAPRFGARAFALFLVLFSLMIVGDQVSLVNATREHIAGLAAEAEEREAEIALIRETAREKAALVDPVRGGEVYKAVCETCHRMDERLVGPPLGAVLPKYAGRLEDLAAFIQKPSKVDPEYPPMPAPGLPRADVRSVAAYLLGQLESRDRTGDEPR
jgi:cytochrome c